MVCSMYVWPRAICRPWTIVVPMHGSEEITCAREALSEPACLPACLSACLPVCLPVCVTHSNCHSLIVSYGGILI